MIGDKKKFMKIFYTEVGSVKLSITLVPQDPKNLSFDQNFHLLLLIFQNSKNLHSYHITLKLLIYAIPVQILSCNKP